MRTYSVDDKKLPSVTTIIGDCTDKSGPLTWWAAGAVCDWIRHNCPEREEGYIVSRGELEQAKRNFRTVSETALDVGSAVHAAIEHWLKTGQEPQDPPAQVLSGFLAFLEWADAHKLETLQTEFTVSGNGWAGTLDWYGRLDGRLFVADWKTSKAIYDEYRYQVAAYAEGVAMMHGMTLPEHINCGILRVDKETGLPEWVDTTDTKAHDYAVFCRMVDLFMTKRPKVAATAKYFEPPF